jgi:hypothetical protein
MQTGVDFREISVVGSQGVGILDGNPSEHFFGASFI